MKLLFICDEFTLDLTGKELNWTEENSYFSEDFILSSTFPFRIEFTENEYFLQFKNYNDYNLQIKYEGTLQRADGKVTPSHLTIESAGNGLTGVIRDGIELFPSWNETINTFPLGVVDVPDMVDHAEIIVPKTYPETKYNFPMIECYSLYENEPYFKEHFRGFYNFRTPGVGFMRNIESTEYNVVANNNIVYPMPYYLHILKTGIEKEGYTLHGDILTDEHFTKAIMPITKIDSFNERPESIEVTVGYGDVVDTVPLAGAWYKYDISLNPNTRYKISGELLTQRLEFRLLLNGVEIYKVRRVYSGHKFNLYIEPQEEIELSYIVVAWWPLPGYSDVIESLIVPMEIYDEGGELVLVAANFNKVDLAERLPEITFGDFVKIFKSMKNYDFDLRPGKQIWMNLIENELTHDNAVDLREFEVEYPERVYEEKGSFLLKYDFISEELPKNQTLVSLTETLTGVDLKAHDDTKEVTIACEVLPVLPNGFLRGEPGAHVTAAIVGDDAGRPALVLFDGLKDDWNYTLPVNDLETPVLIERYWRKFIYFYIRYVKFIWTISGKSADFHTLTKKSKIFSHNNFHIVESLNRKVKGQNETIEITCRTF